MNQVLLANSCCCGGALVPLWSASTCFATSCIKKCDDVSVVTCPSGITFCDQYREDIGLPPKLDPNLCYIMSYGGCLYVVNPPTYVASCSSTPTATHNVGHLYQVIDKPALGTCLTACAALSSAHTWGPEEWVGGFACGSTVTFTYNWSSVYCKYDPCTPDPYGCNKAIGTIATTFRLDQWPTTFMATSSTCNTKTKFCESCTTFNASGEYFNCGIYGDQIANNYCSTWIPPEPCGGLGANISCDVRGCATIYLDINPSPTYSVALTVTRSCSAVDGSWISGTPEELIIHGCLFRVDPYGGRSILLASKINDVLGQAAEVGAVTVTATGSDAWVGPVAYKTLPPTLPCETAIYQPYQWDGPYFSPDFKTATWYAAPVLEYRCTSSLSGSNFSYYWPDVSDCTCTGSNFGGAGAQFASLNAIPLYYGSSASGSSFTMDFDPAYPPPDACYTVPTVS